MVEGNEEARPPRYELQYDPDPPLEPIFGATLHQSTRLEIHSLRFGAEYPSTYSTNPEERASRILKGLRLTGLRPEDYDTSQAELDGLVRKCFQKSARLIILEKDEYEAVGVTVYPLKEEVTELLWKGDADISTIGYTQEELEQIDHEVNLSRAQRAITAIRWLSRQTDYSNYELQSLEIDRLRDEIYKFSERLEILPGELGIPEAELDNLRPTKKSRFVKIAKRLFSLLTSPKPH